MPKKKPPTGNEVNPQTRKLLSEVKRCRESLAHFASTHCQILASSDKSGSWIPFTLWPMQQQVTADLETHREVIALKARQLGFTWLVIAFALRELLLNPVATVLLFSERDDESTELLGYRLRGMYDRLPDWMRSDGLTVANEHEITLKNGSRAMSFATTGGRSYTATLCIVDEADHVPDLQRMLNAIKPTVDAGGRLILLSTVDKSAPESTFKKIYRAARDGKNSYKAIFAPWSAAPWRTPEWYAQKRRDIFLQTGSHDDAEQEYPATDTEALAPRSLDKRIPSAWLMQCFAEARPLDDDTNAPPQLRHPPIPGLIVYARPRPGRSYVIGADPAEGNPTSDDSALCVLDAGNGEQVAELAGKFEPSVFASYASTLSAWYNGAPILPERNNHGHAVILWLTNFAPRVRILCGHDGKPGWLSSSLGKSQMYASTADSFKNKETLLHSFATFTQLAAIDGNTLRAPEGQHDDRADAYALAVCARLAVAGETSGILDESWLWPSARGELLAPFPELPVDYRAIAGPNWRETGGLDVSFFD